MELVTSENMTLALREVVELAAIAADYDAAVDGPSNTPVRSGGESLG